MMAKWALFLSGRGSTAQAVMDVLSQMDLRLVVSSKLNAYGIKRAKRQGINTLILPKKIDWQNLDNELKQRKINRIFLLGFMKIIAPEFCQKWKGKIFNVHPSLLPQHPGLNAIENSFHSGGPMGVTTHHVIAEMDAGQKILSRRVLPQEHRSSLEQAIIKISFAEQDLVRQTALRQELVHE